MRWYGLGVALVLASSVVASAQPAPSSLDAARAQKASGSINPRLDSHLTLLVQQLTTSTPRDLAASVPRAIGDAVPVTIRFEGPSDVLESALALLGVTPANRADGAIEAYVPINLLTRVAAIDPVVKVRMIVPPVANVTSQGVAAHRADTWQVGGRTGSGVKVGIVDVGFHGLLSLLGTELPASVTVRCYPGTIGTSTSNPADCDRDSPHGTAVAETVVDVAPGVQLYLANPASDLDFQYTVQWMTSQGVKVINHSAAWTWAGPGDGTSPYTNAPVYTVDLAVSGGAFWTNAAGNGAQATWSGAFADATGNRLLDFAPGIDSNAVYLHAGRTYYAQLRWEDSWAAANRDLDLYLCATPAGTTCVASFENQVGRARSNTVRGRCLHSIRGRLVLPLRRSLCWRASRMGSASIVHWRVASIRHRRVQHRQPRRERQCRPCRGRCRALVGDDHGRIFQQPGTDQRRPHQAGSRGRRPRGHGHVRFVLLHGRIRRNESGVTARRGPGRPGPRRISEHAARTSRRLPQSDGGTTEQSKRMGSRIRAGACVSCHAEPLSASHGHAAPCTLRPAACVARVRHRRLRSVRVQVSGSFAKESDGAWGGTTARATPSSGTRRPRAIIQCRCGLGGLAQLLTGKTGRGPGRLRWRVRYPLPSRASPQMRFFRRRGECRLRSRLKRLAASSRCSISSGGSDRVSDGPLRRITAPRTLLCGHQE